MRFCQAPILLVEHQPFSARRHHAILSRVAPIQLHSVQDAASALAQTGNGWIGFVVGPGTAPDASLGFLETARRHHQGVPALVIAAASDPAFEERVRLFRADILAAPARASDVRAFAERSVETWLARQPWISRTFADLAGAQALSAREREVLDAAIAGVGRDRAANEMGVSENTYKSYVKTLLRKCGARNLDELALRVLRSLLVSAPRIGAAREVPEPA
jgi:DNA-binding NarL/FixJ family response regulator